ncbi:hypothetical protein Tco_0517393 [Tanacetum coccineum]
MAPRGRPTRTTRSRPVTATPPPVTTTPPPVTDPTTTTSVTSAQLQAMIDEGVNAVLAARAATRNGDDSHTSGTGARRNERTVRECTYQDFMKCQPVFFRGTEEVVNLTQWFERMETVFRISNCTVENQVKFATCTLLGTALTWWNSHARTVIYCSQEGRRINAIDADEDIILVNVQDDADNEIFDVDALNGEEVFVVGQNENVVEQIVDAAQVSTAATTVTINTEKITLAQALEALKTSKPKVKGIVFQEPEPVKPMKKKRQIIFDEEIASKLQAEFDEEERLAREKAKKEKEANIALIEEWDDMIFMQRFNNMEGKKLKDLKNKSFDSIQKVFDRAFKRGEYMLTSELTGEVLKRSRKELANNEECTKKQKVDEEKIQQGSFKRRTNMEDYQQGILCIGMEAVWLLWSTFLDDAVYADLHADRREISSYTTHNYKYAKKEASG